MTGKPPAPPENPSNVSVSSPTTGFMFAVTVAVALLVAVPTGLALHNRKHHRAPTSCTRITLTIDGRTRDYVPAECR